MSSEERWCIRCNKSCIDYRTITDATGVDLHYCNECDGFVVRPEKVQFDYEDIAALRAELSKKDAQLAAESKRADEKDAHIDSLEAEVERLKAALRLCQPEFACLIRQTDAHPNGSVSRAYEAVLSALKEPPHAP